jgi:hypothetical protein
LTRIKPVLPNPGPRSASRYPISQLLGLPYAILPNEAKKLDCIVAALCWRHIQCCWSGGSSAKRVRRRDEFPYWTWAGWAGAISWTDLLLMETWISSLLDTFRCELKDGTTVGLHQYILQRRSGHPYTWCALHFSVWLVPPDMISLHESSGPPCWKIGSFKWEVHISEFKGSPGEFLEAFRHGRLECLFVAKGDYNSFFLFLEPQGGSARRISAAEVMYFEDTHGVMY